ncbi:MAG: hypothetical protein ACR2PO_15080 [Methyloligellaceae bacterium]
MGDEASVEATRALWAECERQLYPMAVSDAPGYQRAIMAARALADEMVAVDSIEQLVSMWPRAGEMLASVALARGLSARSLPQERIAGAAFALREREIVEQSQRQARQDRIEAASRAGKAWVVLDEFGNIDAGLIDPYRCTEMHIESGLAVVALVQPEPSLGTPSFVVTVVRLDPRTGDLLDADPGVEGWVEHTQQEDFVAHRDAVRARIGARTDAAAR